MKILHFKASDILYFEWLMCNIVKNLLLNLKFHHS